MLLIAALATALAAGPARPILLGEAMRQFSLPAINEDAARAIVGKSQVTLADFAASSPIRPAKVLVVYVFSRDAGAEALPLLERAQKKHGARGVQVLAISTDTGDLGGLSTWVEGQKLSFPVLRDNHRIAVARLGLPETPLFILVDDAGDVFALGRPGPDAEGELDALIAGQLTRPPGGGPR
jgi:hypothetical protein